MAQIFVSHSSKDRDLVNFFSNCKSSTKVRFIYEEFEKMVSGNISPAKIRGDIDQSNAVFMVPSLNVQNTQHTRDWVLAEVGVANKKDIWVFERASELGQISVVIPFVRHYVLYEPSDAWIPYIRSIVESYDNSHVLPTIALCGGLGALTGKPNWVAAGLLVGVAAAMICTPRRPQGIQTICANCKSSYNVHLPDQWVDFRCPICNAASHLEYKCKYNNVLQFATN